MTYRQREAFWIELTVRFAFGFLFIIAALNIFTYHDTKNPPPDIGRLEFLQNSLTGFATDLSKPYEYTWLNFKWRFWPAEINPETNARETIDLGINVVQAFLYAMPFVFTILGFCLLSGVALYPALRLSAIFLVMLGLGKYITGDSSTTADDFIYAAFILIALYMTSSRRDAKLAETTLSLD